MEFRDIKEFAHSVIASTWQYQDSLGSVCIKSGHLTAKLSSLKNSFWYRK